MPRSSDLRSFSEQSAQTWVRRIRRAAQTTVDLPRRNRIVPDIGSDEFRELFVGPYRLWYRIRDAEQTIEVFRSFDGRRQVPD